MGKTLVGTEESAGTVTEGVLQIRFFETLRKIHCSLFNEVSGLGTCNFIKR